MNYDSEKLDECSIELNGHSNWAYYDMLSSEQQAIVNEDSEMIVVFYKQPYEDED